MRNIDPFARNSQPVPWYDACSPEECEDLCCEVHLLDPEIARAFPYGRRGHAQLGIDILAERLDGSREAGQCKRYKRLRAKHVSDAVKTFTDNVLMRS